jgi:hypothetical protein
MNILDRIFVMSLFAKHDCCSLTLSLFTLSGISCAPSYWRAGERIFAITLCFPVIGAILIIARNFFDSIHVKKVTKPIQQPAKFKQITIKTDSTKRIKTSLPESLQIPPRHLNHLDDPNCPFPRRNVWTRLDFKPEERSQLREGPSVFKCGIPDELIVELNNLVYIFGLSAGDIGPAGFVKDPEAVEEHYKLAKAHLDSLPVPKKPHRLEGLTDEDALTTLLSHNSGICIGETHGDIYHYRLLTDKMAELKSMGLSHLFLENFMFDSLVQDLLNICPLPPLVETVVSIRSENRDKTIAILNMLREAHAQNIQIVGIDTSLSYDAGHKMFLKKHQPFHMRLVCMNSAALKIMQETTPQKFIAIMGKGHANSHTEDSLSYLGISDALGVPSIEFNEVTPDYKAFVTEKRSQSDYHFDIEVRTLSDVKQKLMQIEKVFSVLKKLRLRKTAA